MTSKLPLKAIILNLSPYDLEAIGATNACITSPRSVRFDLPNGKANGGINRVKMTAREDGSVDVSFLQITEVDLLGGVQPENLMQAIQNFTGLKVN